MSLEHRIKVVFCTIVSANYLSRAQVLKNSLKKYSPEYELKILLCEKPEVCKEISKKAGHEFYSPADIGCRDWQHMAFYYTLIEYNTALKPFFLEQLCKEGYSSVIYFDPDIEVFSSLNELVKLVLASDIVLTPHLCKPFINDNKIPNMEGFIRGGQFNLGFLGITNSQDSLALLKWWQSVCTEKCIHDSELRYFVDQFWADIFPSFVEKACILRYPGYNVAYWNIFQRDLKCLNGKWLIDGKDLKFFHYSGLAKGDLSKVSIYQNRVTAPKGSDLYTILEMYFEKIKTQKWAEFNERPYSFSTYLNGEAITVVERKKFLRLSKQERREFGDPFEKHTEIRSIIDINVAEDNRKRTSSSNLRCIDTD